MNAHDAMKSARAFEPEEPAPLLREIPPGESYPMAALGPLQAPAEAAHDLTQAPPAIGAQAALAVASLAAQAHADVETLGGPAPLSLFALTVAQSGERKSAVDRLLMTPVLDHQRELGASAKDERALHANRLEIWEKQRATILKGLKDDPDGATADLDALGPAPEPPLSPVIVATEPTFEGIAKHLANARPSLGIFNDEGGAFIGGHGMKEENKLRTGAGLSSMWDGSPVNRTRAGDGVESFFGRRLACNLMAQPIAAAVLLSDPVANGQGLLARFLVTEPVSTIGARLCREAAPGSRIELDRFADRIGSLLRRDLPLKEGTRNELDPPVLRLNPEARALLQRFADHVETAQAPGGELEGIRPFASKAAEHAARIAGVLTIYADPDAREVSAETMANAVELASYYLGEAKRLTDNAAISAETADAERLRRWVFETWTDPCISATDAAQYGPGSLRETSRARKLLGILAAHGWLHPLEGGGVVAGKRRREAWRIHGRVIP